VSTENVFAIQTLNIRKHSIRFKSCLTR